MPITRYKSGAQLNRKINVEIFVAPVCSNCQRATRLMKSLVKELDNEHIQWQEIDVITNIDYCVELGVLATPAIAINGKLVFTSLPTKEKLLKRLEQELFL